MGDAQHQDGVGDDERHHEQQRDVGLEHRGRFVRENFHVSSGQGNRDPERCFNPDPLILPAPILG